MTPKDKAKELVEKIWYLDEECELEDGFEFSRRCALIACNEVIKQWEYIDTYLADMDGRLNPNLKYWYAVKAEIKNL